MFYILFFLALVMLNVFVMQRHLDEDNGTLETNDLRAKVPLKE